MVGIPGKGEGIEPQRIHRRQLQQPKIRLCRSQVRQVVGDQVVSQKEVRASSEIVQFRQCCPQVAASKDQRLIDVRAHRGEGVDAVVLLADLEVQREKAGRKTWVHGDVHESGRRSIYLTTRSVSMRTRFGCRCWRRRLNRCLAPDQQQTQTADLILGFTVQTKKSRESFQNRPFPQPPTAVTCTKPDAAPCRARHC